MKTADLIPFILLELNECDKYGFELTKAIETKSNGKIIIKQPTLYTLLKKLEKSKFISSYWEDSEIGGKRHYYKITENGKMQITTLPSYDFLLKKALNDTADEDAEMLVTDTVSTKDIETEKNFSIMDALLPDNEPEETILPTAEVFADNHIDNSTEMDINLANSEILKESDESKEEQFATNKEVMKFTEKISTPTEAIDYNNKLDTNKTSDDILNNYKPINTNENSVKFVDYRNIKTDPQYISAKKLAKGTLYRALITSSAIVIALIIASLITNATGTSALYYASLIISITIAVFYPVVTAVNMDKFKLKCQDKEFHFNIKKSLFIAIAIMLLVFSICIVTNVTIGKNNINAIFSIQNFANMYAPMLFTSIIFIDILFSYLFSKKK